MSLGLPPKIHLGQGVRNFLIGRRWVVVAGGWWLVVGEKSEPALGRLRKKPAELATLREDAWSPVRVSQKPVQNRRRRPSKAAQPL